MIIQAFTVCHADDRDLADLVYQPLSHHFVLQSRGVFHLFTRPKVETSALGFSY